MRFEPTICLIIWVSSIFYSVYRFTHVSKNFRPGWLADGKQDNADREWLVLKRSFLKYFPLFLGHIFLSQLVWKLCRGFTVAIWIVCGSFSIAYVISTASMLLIYFNITVAILIHLTGRKSLIYGLFVASIAFLHSNLTGPKKYLFGGDYEHRISSKNSSEQSDMYNSKKICNKINATDVLMIFAYCLYLPSFFTGPIHHYSDFVKDLNQRTKWQASYLLTSGLQIFRYLFWALVLEYLQHHIYSSAIQFYPEICYSMDSWPLAGLAYSLPCLFHLKYLVIYGMAGVLAKIDGINLPPAPKCVTRMNLSSQLWKHFDRGLHLWLIKYFYKPVIGRNWTVFRTICATLVSFSCVCLWHGFDKTIICWCLLNFFCVSSESVGRALYRKYFTTCSRDGKIQINGQNSRLQRLNSLVGAPYFALMVLSNAFFLSNYELGSCIFQRFLLTYPLPALPALAIMYAACYVSIDWKSY